MSVTQGLHASMVCSRSQDGSGRGGRDGEYVLSHCEYTRHDGTDRQSLSPKVTKKVMKPEKSVSHNVNEEEHSIKRNNGKQDPLQHIHTTDDIVQDGHHSLTSSGFKVERDESSLHGDQREGVARAAPPQKGASEDDLPLRACAAPTVSAKCSRGMAESTSGTHERPAYTTQVNSNLVLAFLTLEHWFLH